MVECATSNEALLVLERVGPCVLLCYGKTQEHLVAHVTLIKLLKEKIVSNKLKIILVTEFKQTSLHAKLKTYGFSEVLPDPVDEKKLAARIDRSVRDLPISLDASLIADTSTFQQPIAITETVENKTIQKEEIKSEEKNIRMVPSLKIKSDFWLFQSDGTKRMIDLWAIKMKGPGPHVGKWEIENESDHTQEEQRWKWVPLENGKNIFLKEVGTWHFYGQAPRFEDRAWHFAGKNPELSFYADGKCLGAKFLTDPNGDLIIAYDSMNAVHFRESIEESINDENDESQSLTLNNGEGTQTDLATVSTLIHKKIQSVLGKLPPQTEQAIVQADPQLACLNRVGLNTGEGTGPKGVLAAKPPGPTLGPLAMAFLMSELSFKQGMSLEDRANRYCQYLAASCGNLTAELWYIRNDLWNRAGTSKNDDSVPGKTGEYLQGLKEGAARIGNNLLAGIIRSNQNQLVGALVISGDGTSGITPEYVLAIGKMASGLLHSFVFSNEIYEKNAA